VVRCQQLVEDVAVASQAGFLHTFVDIATTQTSWYNTTAGMPAQVQDTIIVCSPQMSQQLALAALQEGEQYVQQGIAGLAHNRELIADALSPLGTRGHGWVGGEGAIYYWARLPERFGGDAATAAVATAGDGAATAAAVAGGDEAVVEWLIQKHGVCIIPGSACGVPGHVRVAFANLQPQQCEEAAARLKQGLQQLVSMESVVGV
jgi:katanin p60 ATPase-containing subunit A1